MTIRNLGWVLCVAIGTLLVGCNNSRELIPADAEPELTAEQAKAAMIDLLRSTQLDYLHGFPLDQFVDKTVEINRDGSFSWADFHFDLKSKKYSYTVTRGAPETKAFFAAAYEGEFEFREGKWVATMPHLLWIT